MNSQQEDNQTKREQDLTNNSHKYEDKKEQPLEQQDLQNLQNKQKDLQLGSLHNLEEEEEEKIQSNKKDKLDQKISEDDKLIQEIQDDEKDFNVEDDDEEERKENSSTQNSINQEGPSIKTIPSLFPNTNIMHVRDQNQSNEFIKPFDELHQIVQTLKLKQKFSKWQSDFQDILQQLSEIKQNLIDIQQSNQDRNLRESQLELILEQLIMIRSQFDPVRSETSSLPDEDGTDKANLNQIDEILNKINQSIIKYQRQRINQMNSFISSSSRSNPLTFHQSGTQSNQNADNNMNQNQGRENNNQPNNNNNNDNQNNNQNNNQNINNSQQGQRININGQEVRVVRSYSMSLDLQIFQSLFDGIKLIMNNFDVLLKVIILLSSVIIVFSLRNFEKEAADKQVRQQMDRFVEIMEWIAFQKDAKVFVMSAIIFASFSIILIWRSIWKKMVGEFTNEQRVRVKENFFRFCIFKHLIIVKILDDNIWTNNFDVLVFCCLYMQADVSRFFTDIVELTIKTILNSLSEDYQQELKLINNLKRFNKLLFFWNFLILIICLVIFASVDQLVQLRLMYGLFIAIIWNIRIQLSCNKLVSQNGIQYYVNCNSDIIQEPALVIEQFSNFIQHIFKFAYIIYLGYLYLEQESIEFFQSMMMLYYFIFNFLSTIRKISETIQSRRNTSYFQENIDDIFPKLEITEQNKDDFCSICHDQLLVGRRLKDCSHAFHLKCLFQWIKTQQKPRCPNCRVEIRNANLISSALNHPQQNPQNQNFNIGGQFTFQQVNIQGNDIGANVQQPNLQQLHL